MKNLHAGKVILIPATGEVGVCGKKDSLSDAAHRRIEGALRLWRRGGYDAIIASGGFRQPTFRQTLRECDLMVRELVTSGVPHDAIFTEAESLDCYEVVAGALNIVLSRMRGVPLITIVSGRLSCECAAKIFRSFDWSLFNSCEVAGGDVRGDTPLAVLAKQAYGLFDGCGQWLPARLNRRAVQLRAAGIL